MQKQVIFNVGGALSSYLEVDGKQIVIDLGKNSDFNPVEDFLLPLFRKRGATKNDNNKYVIDQLFLSHPHNDHISSIKEFDASFYADLITVPNDNEGNEDKNNVNWDLIQNQTDEYVKYLREKMLPGRTPPLKSCNPSAIGFVFLCPKLYEDNEEASNANYANNISLAIYMTINGHRTFMPGDLMKDGMESILLNASLTGWLKDGVDYLITPHHGLKSSFSTVLFEKMKNGKTNRLNIVSEKPSSEDSNRVVDSRYSSTDYCAGNNSLSTPDNTVCQRKTSNGHIVIDYSTQQSTVNIVSETDQLIDEFL